MSSISLIMENEDIYPEIDSLSSLLSASSETLSSIQFYEIKFLESPLYKDSSKSIYVFEDSVPSTAIFDQNISLDSDLNYKIEINEVSTSGTILSSYLFDTTKYVFCSNEHCASFTVNGYENDYGIRSLIVYCNDLKYFILSIFKDNKIIFNKKYDNPQNGINNLNINIKNGSYKILAKYESIIDSSIKYFNDIIDIKEKENGMISIDLTDDYKYTYPNNCRIAFKNNTEYELLSSNTIKLCWGNTYADSYILNYRYYDQLSSINESGIIDDIDSNTYDFKFESSIMSSILSTDMIYLNWSISGTQSNEVEDCGQYSCEITPYFIKNNYNLSSYLYTLSAYPSRLYFRTSQYSNINNLLNVGVDQLTGFDMIDLKITQRIEKLSGYTFKDYYILSSSTYTDLNNSDLYIDLQNNIYDESINEISSGLTLLKNDYIEFLNTYNNSIKSSFNDYFYKNLSGLNMIIEESIAPLNKIER